MRQSGRVSRLGILSIALHALILLLLWFAAHKAVVHQETPVSVELWSTPAPQPFRQPVIVPKTAVVKPEKIPVAEPKADIQAGKKREMSKLEASSPQAESRTKLGKKPPVPKPEPKPQPEKKLPVPQEKQKSVVHPKPAAPQKHFNNDANDLLSELGAPTERTPNAKLALAGAAHGVMSGSPGGTTSHSRDSYAAKVQALVLPLVQLPAGLEGNPLAVVKVSLYPTLQVRSVRLLQSSGNPAYDEAVKRAIAEAGTFPSLPAGTSFGDVRELTLRFRPQ